MTMPSRFDVITTAHRAHARSGSDRVPGICGTQTSKRKRDFNTEYCVYATPRERATAGVAFMGGSEPDVVIVAAVPEPNMRVRFERDHGRPIEGTIVRVPGATAPQLAITAIPRRALGGRLVVFRAHSSYRLASDHLSARDCSRPSYLCSIGLSLPPRGAAPDASERNSSKVVRS